MHPMMVRILFVRMLQALLGASGTPPALVRYAQVAAQIMQGLRPRIDSFVHLALCDC